MGKTRYQAIIEMMALIPGDVVHLEVLKMHIRRNIATSELKMIETLRTMESMGLVKEISPFKYKLEKPDHGKVL